MIKTLKRLHRYARNKVTEFFVVSLGFLNIHNPIIWGDKKKVIKGINVTLNNAILNTRSGKIILEDNVWCGHNVMILTGIHIERHNVPSEGFDVRIGEGTWLASGCIVLGRVNIGKHCIIGAGAVVTKDIPDYSLVVGVPARVVRNLRRSKAVNETTSSCNL
jgi:acetyltransferase-like isoleucine patch superfamily enzyme